MTISDAAELVGSTPVTVRRWIEEGLLETFFVGPHRFVVRNDIHEAVRARRAQPRSRKDNGAYRLLVELAKAPPDSTTAELATAVGLHWTTAVTYLRILARQGFAVRGNARDSWRSTPAGRHLASS